MTINKNLKVEGFLKMYDIDRGECFCFLDDNELYLRTDEDFYIQLSTGSVFYENGDVDRPVRKINAEINILN